MIADERYLATEFTLDTFGLDRDCGHHFFVVDRDHSLCIKLNLKTDQELCTTVRYTQSVKKQTVNFISVIIVQFEN